MKKETILILGEEISRRNHLVFSLSKLDYNVLESVSYPEAHRYLLSSYKIPVVVVSLFPFEEQHIKNLKSLKESEPQPSLLLVSEIQNQELALGLLEKEVVDHIIPLDHLPGLVAAIKNELNKRELIQENELYRQNLDKLKLIQERNNKRAEDLEEIYETTLESLMTALDLRDVETFGHSRTVAKYSLVLAKILGIKDRPTLDNVKKGALLHDVGKIAIPDSILKKPSPLSPEEWEKIKLHPSLGYGLIKEINSKKEIENIILYHHERYDGTGYPKGLNGKDIPIEARIFALVDALDAITSHRPYSEEREFDEAKKEIEDNSGTQFDPAVVDAFTSLGIDKWKRIRFETTKILPSVEYMRDISKI